MHIWSFIVLHLHINPIIRDIFGICTTISFCLNFIFKVIFLRLIWINNFKAKFTVYISLLQARTRRCGSRKQTRRSKANQESMNDPYKSPSDETTISSKSTLVESKTVHRASNQHSNHFTTPDNHCTAAEPNFHALLCNASAHHSSGSIAYKTGAIKLGRTTAGHI